MIYNKKLNYTDYRFLRPFFIIITLSLIRCHSTAYDKSETVLTVNDEPICIDEFYHVMSGMESSVFSYFTQKYSITDSKDFWKSNLGGEVPLDYLIKETTEKLKSIKTEQLLIKEFGIANDISYSGFLKGLSLENERRVRAVANNQPIYGPLQYDEKIYYEYINSERREKLKKLLSRKELSITREEMLNYYSKNISARFTRPGNVKIEKISFQLNNENEVLTAELHNKNENKIKKLLSDINSGKKFTVLADEYNHNGVLDLDYEILIFDDSTIKTYTYQFSGITDKISGLMVNQVSEIINEGDTYSVIKILKKDPDITLSIDEVADYIVKELTDLKYEIKIRQLTDEATIVLNEPVIKKIYAQFMKRWR